MGDNLDRKLDELIQRQNIGNNNSNSHKFPGLIRIPPATKSAQSSGIADVPAAVRAKDPVVPPAAGSAPQKKENSTGARTRGPSTLRQELEHQIDKYYGPDAITYAESKSLVIWTGQPEYIFPGVCMSDISRDTGLTLPAVSRIFNGKRKARRSTLKSIANIYCEGRIEEVEKAIRDRVVQQIKLADRRGQKTADRDEILRRVM